MQPVRWVPSSTCVREKPEGFSIGIVKGDPGFSAMAIGTLVTFQLSTAGGNSGYPRLIFLGAVGVAPSAAVAVDNPLRIVPGCGQRHERRLLRSFESLRLNDGGLLDR